ncbi:nucleoside recognition domain protein [Rhizobium leguminosarum bv. trifolii]|uniref:nucleoside recognition domain-containing protein n=1 Tax=Rhizobium leguminosarum TaxID=384 RepID=UPI000E2E8B04|nr:nucleoside recognition domain-containing protein [Rhizobium leguminosarum]RFB87565.1 nucleoside recognition domain protein [Rhizobium leguminosarum bv. trifolii]
MREFIELILDAGRSAVDVALYTLLPIMVVMTIFLRFLEVYGVFNKLTTLLTPLLRPFGLTGLSAVALLQVGLVSFAAPLPTLMRMERAEPNDRRIAATLAAVFASAPANGLFPMAAYGINTGRNFLISLVCALVASSCCFYVFGRSLGNSMREFEGSRDEVTPRPSILKIIETGGAEAVATVLKLIPMLLLSLAVVYAIQKLGVFEAMEIVTRPIFKLVGLSPDIIAPSFVAYIAGTTALVGFYDKLGVSALATSPLASDAAMGFLVHSVNLVSVLILLSVGPKIARSTPPAIAAGLVGIALRITLGCFV